LRECWLARKWLCVSENRPIDRAEIPTAHTGASVEAAEVSTPEAAAAEAAAAEAAAGAGHLPLSHYRP
jgi:hypothetical protein